MKFDYQSPLLQARWYRLRKYIVPALIFISLTCFLISILLQWHDKNKSYATTEEIVTDNSVPTTPLIRSNHLNQQGILKNKTLSLSKSKNKIILEEDKWQELIVQSGDNISKIFSRLNINQTILSKILQASPTSKNLYNIHPGQKIFFLFTPENKLKEVKLNLSNKKTLHIRAIDDNYKYFYSEKHLTKKLSYSSGKIRASLFTSAQNAGLNDKLIMQLAGIFGWDIDFALDIRPNDSFRILYEEEYLGKTKIDTGNIIAAEFINQGKIYSAIRFTDDKGITGYYSPNGYSMQKAFLRTPVNFTRISSHFSTGRKHPILHRIRAHKGVDYAAPYGTPIKAAGNGKVTFLGNKNGYGKTIVLQHGRNYSTLYAHMANFKAKLKKGSHVKQGEIIGYVGHTGLATGDHLHYEFHVNGKHKNPLTVNLPKALPIGKRNKAAFLSHAAKILENLNQHAQG